MNANFEPINVCNMRRAVGLMVLDKANLVLNGRGFIQTVRMQYPKPSVIRLQYIIHRPRPQVHLTRKEVFRRDQYKCQYCGEKSNNLTIDHILPKHLGGEHTWENVVTACYKCNHQKGGRTISRSGMKLMKIPNTPPASAIYIFGKYLNQNSEWVQFLEGW